MKKYPFVLLAATLSISLDLTMSTLCRAADASTPLERLSGNWLLIESDGKSMALANRCMQAQIFFVCEQSVDGKPDVLLIFLPKGHNGGGYTFGTEVILANGSPPGPWGILTIDGDDWTYTQASEHPSSRTLNHFADQDHIQFYTQILNPDKTWKTIASGNETRQH